jgi:hypothetical protein
MDYEKHFSRYAQGLPTFFPGCVSLAVIPAFNPKRINKDKGGILKIYFMHLQIDCRFFRVKFNVPCCHALL